MTGKNPNVFYEVGYAHAMKKPCALITQNSSDIPFDLQHHAHIIYGGRIAELKSSLTSRLEWMKAEWEKSRTEKIQASIKTHEPTLEVCDYLHQGKFDLRLALKNISGTRSPEIDSITLLTASAWKVFQNGSERPFEEPEKGRKKSFIQPLSPRIAPNAISQTEVTLKRTFWTKWSGDEKKEAYRSKGKIHIEVLTAEKSIPFDFDLDLEFIELPF
jgi:hypothetical protein